MRKRAHDHRAPLDKRIGVHDRHQFELKLEYQPSSEAPSNRYVVESFMFIPASLNVTPETVLAQDLYADIHNYVRLKTPELSWSEMQALPNSPLVQAEAEVTRAMHGDPSRFGYECKLFGCVFRRAMREVVEQIETEAAERRLDRHVSQVEGALDGAFEVAAQFRRLRDKVDSPGFPERGRAAFRLADEFISLSVEQSLRRALVHLGKIEADAPVLKKGLLEAILHEERYRVEQSYASVIDPEGDNEGYVYRSGLLKKYCSSALFLQIRRFGARQRWQELLFAISAGIAMAFATVIAFWAQGRAEMLGMRLFAVLVIAYMFKDRIKEGMRGLFARLLERHLFDRKILIDDPAGGSLGTCREKIEYIPLSRVHAEVLAMRHEGDDPIVRVAEAELHESIYHYKKEIVLSAKKVEGHRGGAGVTDIMRFHIGRLLREMDEPYHVIDWIDLATHRLGPVSAAKVYRVDVVFRFLSREKAPSITLARLILDRRGIKRIERVSGPA